MRDFREAVPEILWPSDDRRRASKKAKDKLWEAGAFFSHKLADQAANRKRELGVGEEDSAWPSTN